MNKVGTNAKGKLFPQPRMLLILCLSLMGIVIATSSGLARMLGHLVGNLNGIQSILAAFAICATMDLAILGVFGAVIGNLIDVVSKLE